MLHRFYDHEGPAGPLSARPASIAWVQSHDHIIRTFDTVDIDICLADWKTGIGRPYVTRLGIDIHHAKKNILAW